MKDLVDGIVEAWRAELPEVAGVELELSKRAVRIGALLTEATERQLARFKLTKAEYDVLAVLRASGRPYRLRPTDLAARLFLSSGGTSNVLRRLTEAKLIKRGSDETDARSSWVQLTAHGVQTAEAAVVASNEAQRQLLSSVPPETVEAAVGVLREVLVALGDRPF
ncbi:MarR family winged helix-turn-helix transcriptional regulator [Actinocrispum wychmicini]|uniref:DNA-binding MarR family transcriptional regulator n=1 Tax=Actinocrispum wychmicini TaxID=1213861 RepID=A0A4R2JQD2_9PSEU|nr:MarR family transcriptional regulator [Actinocrispum wychmicini]TCO62433.1 DNA-binding MarR family transcriptional regulator [Actinocrispum wychmicini]